MAKRRSQLGFEGASFQKKICFGGSLLKGNAREKRPIDTKMPLHLVLRAQVDKGRSMLSPVCYNEIHSTIKNTAKKYGVTLYDYANVGNHLHFLIRVTNRHVWGAFIRELTGRIAQITQGISGREKGRKFWIHKPFTRVVQGWGKAFKLMKEYITLNLWEATGNLPRKEFKTLKQLREFYAEDRLGP
jgi:REP element-mobilizing transposase RayT